MSFQIIRHGLKRFLDAKCAYLNISAQTFILYLLGVIDFFYTNDYIFFLHIRYLVFLLFIICINIAKFLLCSTQRLLRTFFLICPKKKTTKNYHFSSFIIALLNMLIHFASSDKLVY